MSVSTSRYIGFQVREDDASLWRRICSRHQTGATTNWLSSVQPSTYLFKQRETVSRECILPQQKLEIIIIVECARERCNAFTVVK